MLEYLIHDQSLLLLSVYFHKPNYRSPVNTSTSVWGRDTLPACLSSPCSSCRCPWPYPHLASSGPSANLRGAANQLLDSPEPLWSGRAGLVFGILPFQWDCSGWSDHPPSNIGKSIFKEGQVAKSYLLSFYQLQSSMWVCCRDPPVKIKVAPSYLRLFQGHSVAADSEALFPGFLLWWWNNQTPALDSTGDTKPL